MPRFCKSERPEESDAVNIKSLSAPLSLELMKNLPLVASKLAFKPAPLNAFATAVKVISDVILISFVSPFTLTAILPELKLESPDTSDTLELSVKLDPELSVISPPVK